MIVARDCREIRYYRDMIGTRFRLAFRADAEDELLYLAAWGTGLQTVLHNYGYPVRASGPNGRDFGFDLPRP